MENRIEKAGELFRNGYNCSQSVFAAFSDLYGFDQDTALRVSSSFGGGVGRMREVCGAVSGMSMIAGLETGSVKKMDQEGKQYNYEIVRKLADEFKKTNGSIVCRELLGLDRDNHTDPKPEKRTKEYYNKRPCEQIVMDAAEIMERVLFHPSLIPVTSREQMEEVAEIALPIWHEHYDSIIGSEQVDYMLDQFQSVSAMKEQIHKRGYQYYQVVCAGGLAGYFAIQLQEDSIFLSKLYIAKKFRRRGYAKEALRFIIDLCVKNHRSKIWLTVNRENLNSIKVYENLGFVKEKTQVSEIGAGFVMDDYVMVKYQPNNGL